MTRSPFDRTRFFVLLWLIAGLVVLAWYLGDQAPVAGGRVMAQSPPKVGNTTLVGPYWRAIELAGKPVPTQDAKREAHLVFKAGGRLSGSDGCNQLTGSYELKGDAIAFGQLAGTQMACINIGNTDHAFRDALKHATRVTAAADRLQFSDAAGTRLAVFAARQQSSQPTTSSDLTGTSWQLVNFRGSDGTTLTPDDRATYSIRGQLTMSTRNLIRNITRVSHQLGSDHAGRRVEIDLSHSVARFQLSLVWSITPFPRLV